MFQQFRLLPATKCSLSLSRCSGERRRSALTLRTLLRLAIASAALCFLVGHLRHARYHDDVDCNRPAEGGCRRRSSLQEEALTFTWQRSRQAADISRRTSLTAIVTAAGLLSAVSPAPAAAAPGGGVASRSPPLFSGDASNRTRQFEIIAALGKGDAEKIALDKLTAAKNARGLEDMDTLRALEVAGTVLLANDQSELAARLFKQQLAVCLQKFGQDDANSLWSMNNLGIALRRLDRTDEAGALLKKAVDLRAGALGQNHPDTLASQNNYANFLKRTGEVPAAEKLYQSVLEGRRQVLGNTHPDTLTTLSNLALLFDDTGRREEAIRLETEALDGSRRRLGNLNPDTLLCVDNLGSMFYEAERVADAEPLFREAVEGFRKTLGATHPDTLTPVSDYQRTSSFQKNSFFVLNLA
eukprot:TRINITY_DN33437_c0_g1_i2.p1 TRINITY_DN33437_c0_g1~~TRINITY_DN33437_c0_g1_i2.p1  ORF type:complete len:413 (-),score=46.94 TRINITY_DN33437_c0_g1_i2:65-1303(-)